MSYEEDFEESKNKEFIRRNLAEKILLVLVPMVEDMRLIPNMAIELADSFIAKLNEGNPNETNSFQEKEKILRTPISEIEMSKRTRNILTFAGVVTLNDMISIPYRDYVRMKNCGRKSANEISDIAKKYGFSLRQF